MANDSFMEAVITGNRRTAESLLLMDARVDVQTAKALKQVVALTKRSVRGQLRGGPRWNRRGKSARTGPEVRIEGAPTHSSKSGGPGKFTGSLYNSITGSKKPRVNFHEQSVAVFAGSKGKVQNLYKGQLESKFPYFKPGVNKAVPKMPAIWERAWGEAVKT
jgi:hypothetical protein